MANDGERFLVAPSGRSQSLFAVDNDELRQLATLESWPPDHVACTNGIDRLASRKSQRTTLLARFSAADGLTDESRIEAPENVRVEAIVLAGNLLFGGGIEETPRSELGADYSHQRPWIGWCDVTERLKWTQISIGSSTSEFINKGIDALVISGTNLLAFDNIREPLFVLVFDLASESNSPVHLSTLSLNVHNTYERIIDASANGQFVASLSSGVNHGITGQYISVSKPSSIESEACLFAEHSGMLGEFPGGSHWKQVALAGSRIYVAAGDASLGVGDIIYQDGIAYLGEFGRVDRVTPVGDLEDCVVISTNNDGLWSTRLVSVPLGDIRNKQRAKLGAESSDLERLLSHHFELRFGLVRVDVLSRNERFRKRYQTSKFAEIRDGKMFFPAPNYQESFSAREAHAVRVSTALIRAGMNYDVCSPENPSIVLADHDDPEIERAIECVMESLLDV